METTTQPTISDAMTADQLQQACRALAAEIGKGAWVSAIVSDHAYRDGLHVSVYTSFGKDNETLRGTSWPEAFAAAYRWLVTRAQVHRNNITKRMALKIIEITDEHGSCPEGRLRAADFSREEIAEFHEAACVRAGEMAGNQPFVVLMEGV